MFRPLSTPILIGIAGTLTAVASVVLLQVERDSPTADVGVEILGEKATAALSAPSTLTVTAPDRTTTLRRDDGVWRVAEKHGYPALQDHVAGLLERLRRPDVLRRVTADESRFEDLGVGADEGAWRRRIVVQGPEGADPLEIVVGTDRSAPGSEDLVAVHVRPAGSNDVWLVDTDLAASANPMDWIDGQAIAIPRAEIRAIRTAPAAGNPLELEREGPASTNLQPRTLPDDNGHLEPGALTEPAGAFTAVVFEDVRRAGGAVVDEGEAGMVRTMGGTRLRFWFETENDVVWTRFSIEAGDPAEATDDAEGRAEDAYPGIWTPPNVRLEDWAFRLPDYTLERLRWSLEDIPRARTEAEAASQAE